MSSQQAAQSGCENLQPTRWQHQSVATVENIEDETHDSTDPRPNRWTHQSAVTLKDEPMPCKEKCVKCGKQRRVSSANAIRQRPVSTSTSLRPLYLVEQVKAEQAQANQIQSEQATHHPSDGCKDSQCVKCGKQKRPVPSLPTGVKPLHLVEQQAQDNVPKCQKCGGQKRPQSLPSGPKPLRRVEAAHVRSTSSTPQTSDRILPVPPVTASIAKHEGQLEVCTKCGKSKRPLTSNGLPPSADASHPDLLQRANAYTPDDDHSPLVARRADRYLPKSAYERQSRSKEHGRASTGSGTGIIGEQVNSLIRRVSSRGHHRNASNPTPYKTIYHGSREDELFLDPGFPHKSDSYSPRTLLSQESTIVGPIPIPIPTPDLGETFSQSLDLRGYTSNGLNREVFEMGREHMSATARPKCEGHPGWYGLPGNHGKH